MQKQHQKENWRMFYYHDSDVEPARFTYREAVAQAKEFNKGNRTRAKVQKFHATSGAAMDVRASKRYGDFYYLLVRDIKPSEIGKVNSKDL